MKILNKEIGELVRQQGASANEQKEELDLLKSSIMALQTKIKDIKQKAVLIMVRV